MQNFRSIEQQIEQLDYMGDMVRQLSQMASEDNQSLLTYILNTAVYEIEDQKRIKRGALVSNDRGNNSANASFDSARQF